MSLQEHRREALDYMVWGGPIYIQAMYLSS